MGEKKLQEVVHVQELKSLLYGFKTRMHIDTHTHTNSFVNKRIYKSVINFSIFWYRRHIPKLKGEKRDQRGVKLFKKSFKEYWKMCKRPEEICSRGSDFHGWFQKTVRQNLKDGEASFPLTAFCVASREYGKPAELSLNCLLFFGNDYSTKKQQQYKLSL